MNDEADRKPPAFRPHAGYAPEPEPTFSREGILLRLLFAIPAIILAAILLYLFVSQP